MNLTIFAFFGHFWHFWPFWAILAILGIFGCFGRRLRGGAKKGLKRARSYIYIATRAFWALFGAWGGSCKGQPRRARKGPPTSPLLTGGTRRVVAHNEKPQKGPQPKKHPKMPKIAKIAQNGQKCQKWPKKAKMVKFTKKGKKGEKDY